MSSRRGGARILSAGMRRRGGGAATARASLPTPQTRAEFAAQVRAGRRDFSGLDLRNLDLSGFRQGSTLRLLNFSGSNLSLVDAHRTIFERCNFHDATLEYAGFQEARFLGGNFQGANANQADFTGSIWYTLSTGRGADLRDADLEASRWADSQIKGVNFSGANLTNANFRDITEAFSITRTRQADANITGADFRHAILDGVVWPADRRNVHDNHWNEGDF